MIKNTFKFLQTRSQDLSQGKSKHNHPLKHNQQLTTLYQLMDSDKPVGQTPDQTVHQTPEDQTVVDQTMHQTPEDQTVHQTPEDKTVVDQTSEDETLDPIEADSKIGNIPKRYKVLSGSTNWKNLLNPVDDDLRRYIIHCGERAMATYESFNSEFVSQYSGSCRYNKNELFSKVGLIKGNPFRYQITKYIYATSALNSSTKAFMYESLRDDAALKNTNWMGYVAVCTDKGKAALGRRDIMVAWRGTTQIEEWFKDADGGLVPAGNELFPGSHGVLLHRGFKSVYVSSNKQSKYAKTSARTQVLSEVRRLVKMYKNEETTITVTGHSLGAALGTINAIDIAASKAHRVQAEDGSDDANAKKLPVTAFMFATPQTGNMYLKELAQKLNVKILRMRNIRDIVPAVPPVGIYVGVGEELRMDSMLSDYLNNPGDVGSWHDLEIYMHLVAGTRGLFEELKLGKVKRDIDLINKYTAALKAKYLVPAYWRVTANKNMVQQSDGSWKLNDKPNYFAVEDGEDEEGEDDESA